MCIYELYQPVCHDITLCKLVLQIMLQQYGVCVCWLSSFIVNLCCSTESFGYTVTLLYKGHAGKLSGYNEVVAVVKWSRTDIYTEKTACDPCREMVFVGRWPLVEVGLYITTLSMSSYLKDISYIGM